jgi:hypothetical protein
VGPGVPGDAPACPVQPPGHYRFGVLVGVQPWPGVKAGSPGVLSGTTLASASLPSADPVSPVCAPAVPVQVQFRRAVRRPVRHRGRRRRLCTGWVHELCFKRLFLPPDYKYPFTYLGDDKVAIQIISLPSLSHPLKSTQSLRISHSTHSNPNPFGRKIEETPIYVSTKPNFIPPCIHRVLLVTLGFVGNPRRLGSPGGIRLVIRPVESL